MNDYSACEPRPFACLRRIAALNLGAIAASYSAAVAGLS
jgi:hypothetical protein